MSTVIASESSNGVKKTSFPKQKIKIVLLENIHPLAVEMLNREQFHIECHKGALVGEELKEAIRDAHVLGIR
jgi:D-3-phosphoglycerate dehydrogenase